MSTAWAEFLRQSDAEMRRGDRHRGLAYVPDPGKTTIESVAEYLLGFGWGGVGAREVIAAVRRDERGVKRALASLVGDGIITVSEQMTRGPKASKRKVYYSLSRVSIHDDLDVPAQEVLAEAG